jgi:hypothetical protein
MFCMTQAALQYIHIIHKCTNCGQEGCHSLLCYHHQWILKQTNFLSSSNCMTRTRCCWFIPFSLGFLLGQTRCKQCIYNTKNTGSSKTIIGYHKFWEDAHKVHKTLIQNFYGKEHAGINADSVKDYIFFLMQPQWLLGPHSPQFSGYQRFFLP